MVRTPAGALPVPSAVRLDTLCKRNKDTLCKCNKDTLYKSNILQHQQGFLFFHQNMSAYVLD